MNEKVKCETCDGDGYLDVRVGYSPSITERAVCETCGGDGDLVDCGDCGEAFRDEVVLASGRCEDCAIAEAKRLEEIVESANAEMARLDLLAYPGRTNAMVYGKLVGDRDAAETRLEAVQKEMGA